MAGHEEDLPHIFNLPEGCLCPLCGSGMTGAVLQDPRGRVFCGRHANEVQLCRYCEQAFLGGSDRSPVCPTCVQRGVRTDEQLQRHASRVAAWFARHRLYLDKLPTVSLADRMPKFPDGREMLGYRSLVTLFVWSSSQVVVKRGMPPELALATLAHEFGHLWLDRNAPDLEEAATEGVCDFLAHVFAREQPSDEFQWLANRIARRLEPVYGEAVRRVLSLAEGAGPEALPRILRHLSAGRLSQE
jgi:hypothetical protein